MELTKRLIQALDALGIRDGDRLGVACSGGADSTALVHLLVRAKPDLELVVLHVDHGLRPDSADDAEFVQELSAGLGLVCRVLTVHVERRGSLEAVAREARYVALEATATDCGLRWIATGHTLDDQAETVLLRMLRGGSLGGIAPARGIFVRPLLDVRRDELRAWLGTEGIAWREDPTNDDLRLERNWVRNVLVPVLQERRPGVAKVLARVAATERADERVLDALVADVFSRAEVDEAGVLVPADELAGLGEAIGTRVIRLALRSSGVDPSWTDIEAIRALSTGGHLRSEAVTVWRLDAGLAFMREPQHPPPALPLPAEGTVELQAWGIRVRVGSAVAAPWTWRSPLPATAVSIRARRNGDRVRTSVGTRKVQDVLIDAKVPRPLRDFVPVVAGDDGALAVVGLTSQPEKTGTVVDVEPFSPTWSRKSVWSRASS